MDNTQSNGANARNPEGYQVVVDAEATGLMTWWRSLGGEITVVGLQKAAAAEGFDLELLPPAPSEEVALSRAITDLRSKRCDVRQAKTGTWQVTKISDTENGSTSVLGVTSEVLDFKASLLVRRQNGRLVFTPSDHDDVGVILASFKKHQRVFTNQDISSWLIRLLRGKLALTMKDSGGVYFIPKNQLSDWAQIVKVIERAGTHRVMEVPVKKSAKLIEELLDCLNDEAKAFAASIHEELAGKKLGEEAISNRSFAVEAMHEKMTAYEELLGRKADTIREVLKALETSLAVALLAEQAQA